MVILANHPTNSGAVPKSNKLQQQDALTELTERMQRSLAESHMKPAMGGRKLAKKQRSGKKRQKSAKKQAMKSKRKGVKSPKRAETRPAKRMKEKQGGFEFQACDYLDLVEVGYRPNSDYNCEPGDKFLFKVLSFV